MDRIKIGQVVKPQGINGEIKIACDQATEYLHLTKVFMMGRQFLVEKSRVYQNYLFLKLYQYDKIEDVEGFRGQNVFALKQEIPLQDDQYFIDDVVGCKVIDQYGQEYGMVSKIENFGSKDVYTLHYNGQERMFACVDALIKKVDLDHKVIVVNKEKLDEVLL